MESIRTKKYHWRKSFLLLVEVLSFCDSASKIDSCLFTLTNWEIQINKGSNLRLSLEIIQLLIRKPDFDDDDSWFSKILFQFLSCANKLIFLRFLREKLLEKEKTLFKVP